jgi:outer membrane protein OmpA-like peptidoglycan-associated protein
MHQRTNALAQERPLQRSKRRPREAGHALLALQREAGNVAVASLLSLQRSCGCGCAGGGDCAEKPVQRADVDVDGDTSLDDTAGATGASVGRGGGTDTTANAADAIFGTPCTPFTSRLAAEAAFSFVRDNMILFASAVGGTELAALWNLYLNRNSKDIPRPLQTLTGKPGLTTSFQSHHKSAEAEQGLLDEVIAKVNDGTIAVTPGTPKRVSLAAAIGAGTVRGMLNKGGTQEMGFDQVATTAAGNITGGVGAGGVDGSGKGGRGVDPDTRNASGDVVISVTDATTSAGGTVSVTPSVRFQVHDTIDFCPGNIGDGLGRLETVPMSRLEATEDSLGPVFAADVPFDIDYPGPGAVRTGTFAPVQPVPPVFPPPAPVVLSNKVLFDFGSSTLKPDGRRALTGLLPKLRSSGTTEIIGHTDSVGTDKFNQGLSERRAQAVVDELLAQDASLLGRLQPTGRGEQEPVDTNDTAAGRANNRRVEVVFGQ